MKKLAIFILFLLINFQAIANTNNQTTKKGEPLLVSELSKVVQNCVIENGYEPTTLLSDVIKLDCSSKSYNNKALSEILFLNNLESLILDDNPNITSILALKGLTKLSNLSLANNASINLDDINTLQGLVSLTLTNNPTLRRIKINKLLALTDLSIVNSPGINLDIFSSLPNITHISLKKSIKVDLSTLIDFKQLISLRLEDSAGLKLDVINKLINLVELYLPNMGLTAIPDLSTNKLLKVLDISGNQIVDLTNLPSVLDELNLKGTGQGNCNDLNGTEISSIEIGGPDFHNINDCLGVIGLKNLTIVDAPNLDAIQNINNYAGFCGLGFTNTSIKTLNGSRPVMRFGALNNQGLKAINIIKKSFIDANNEYPDLSPRSIVIGGSTLMNCKSLYDNKERLESLTPVNMMLNSIYTKVDTIEKTSLECPASRIPDYRITPDLCLPDLIDGFIVTKGFETDIYSLKWDRKYHSQWGVVSYDVRVNGIDVTTYDADVVLPLDIDLTPAIVGGRLNLASFEVRACTLDNTDPANPVMQCGNWQSTETGCEIECTDSNLSTPILSAPTSNSTGDYSVSWSSEYFRNELQQSIGANNFITVQNDSSLNKSFINQLNNTSYQYKVRGCSEGNVCSRYSLTKSVNVSLQIPVMNALASTSVTGDYTVSWQPVSYDSTVESYELQEKVNNGSWTTITNNISYSHDFTNKLNGNNYSYQIKACRTNNNCSNFSVPKIISVQLQTPVVNAVPSPNTTGDYTVSWQAVTYDSVVDNYQLQEKINNGGWNSVSTVNRLFHDFTGKSNGINYSYRVKACRVGNNCSYYSNIRTVEVRFRPNIPTINVPGPISTTGIYTVSWNAQTFATNYELQQRINAGSFVTVQNTASLSKAFNNTSNDYSYRVRACNGTVCSAYSTIGQITVDLPLPAPVLNNLDIIDTDGNYTVSWSSINATHHYLIEEKIGKGNWTSFNNGTSTSKFYSHSTDGINQYRVQACNASNTCGDYSEIKKTILNIPQYTSETPASSNTIPVIESGSASVGSSGGGFQTDQMGQASYTLPIFAGAGTAGLSPKISLNYSSSGGNGSLGVGWSMSGVTVITRCRETEESRDGATSITPKPFTWGTEDKLCLNGERLFVTSGSYWGNASTYRTERDQFARITYYTSNYLTVERKDGSTAYYGNTTDSNIKANVNATTPTYAWAINRFQDNMSNYIDYTYNDLPAGVNAGELEFVLTDVDYTGHISNPTIAPYNKIHFTYESSRPDTTTSYISGAKIEMNLRLSQVESNIDNTEVRSYTLNYSTSATTSRSLMDSVLECRGATCLPATQFSWAQPGLGFLTSTTNSTFPTNIKSSKLGDINGDGRADLIFVKDESNAKYNVAFGNGSTGFGVITATNLTAPTGTSIDKKWQLIDYNADGRQDIMRLGLNDHWYVHYAIVGSGANGVSGFSTTGVDTNIQGTVNDDFEIADVNGDGLADIVYPNINSRLSVRYLERSGTQYAFSTQEYDINLPSQPSQITNINCVNNDCNEGNAFVFLEYAFFNNGDFNLNTADVNGDGVADLLLKVDIATISIPNNRQLNAIDTQKGDYLFYSQGNKKFELLTREPGEPEVQVLSTHWVAFVSNGGNAASGLDFTSKQQYLGRVGDVMSSNLSRVKFADINADGMTDVLYRNTDNSFQQWEYRLSNGVEFLAPALIGTIPEDKHIQLMDYNGDGYIDILNFSSAQSPYTYYARLWNGNGFNNNILTQATAQDPNTNINFFLDLNGDGREDHFRITPTGSQKIYIREDSYTPIDKITAFTNGMDATTKVYYQPLTFSSVYTQGTGASQMNYGHGSPVFDYLSSMYVIRSVTTDAPTESNANNTTSMYYYYQAARVQSGGRGFLGFESVTTSVPVKASNDNDKYVLETETTYHQDFPYIGLPESVTVSQTEVPFVPPNDGCSSNPQDCFPPPCFPGENCQQIQRAVAAPVMLSQTINTVDSTSTVGNSVFAYIDSTTEQTFDPDTSSLLKTRVQNTSHDSYGNPTNNTVKVYAGLSNLLQTITTVNTYINNTSNWKIGLLDTTTSTVSRPALASVNTFVDYDYNLTTGLLSQELRLPNDGIDKALTIRHKYDFFGNETKTISCSSDLSISACDNTSSMQAADITHPYRIHRYNELSFDAKGRYVNSVKNSLNQTVSTITGRDIYGNPITSIDLLGTTTTNTYDTLGEKQTSYSSLGTWSYSSKKWCTSISGTSAITCPSNAAVRITNRTQGGAVSYSFIDKLGRTVATTEQSFNEVDSGATSGDDKWVINKQFYDELGRGVKQQGPYFYAANYKPITSTEYDRYNRVTNVTMPDGNTESINYIGFKTITTNALNQTKTETKNAMGELIEVQDYIGGKLNYTYNAQGLATQIRRTTDGKVELLIDNTYDKAGRKTISNSVDTGTSSTDYNAEGEIVSVQDSKGQVANTYRDVLGRVYLTETFDSSNTKKTSYNYTFNAANNLLLKETDMMSAEAYQKYYFYDNLNRIAFASLVIDDTENVCNTGGVCNFVNYNYYDQYSRSKIQQDASGKAIENSYNSKGYLNLIKDKSNASKEYYKVVSTDARGNVTSDRKSANLYTDYTYDVDRGFMKSITANSVGTAQNYEYDALGNITKRVDGSKSECFQYDGLNRLTNTHRSNGASCTQTSGNVESTSMVYDGRGNITQKDGQTYTYDDALANSIGNSPHQVRTKGSQSFSYDANGNNTSMTLFNSPEHGLLTRNIEYTTFDKIEHVYLGSISNPTEEAFYKYDTSNNRYARVDINAAGEKKVTFFIGSTEVEYNNGQAAKYKRQLGNFAIIEEYNGVSTDRYLFTDHLGSVDKITDASGNTIQSMSFSAWGERRLPSNWDSAIPLSTLNQLSTYTNSGYTGHEMVDAFGIINMGGRIYDAALGRMLQADPFVQDPTNTQSFNRYTYVYNNPLSYTDPSGYFSLRQALGIVVGIVLSIYLGPLVNAFWSGFISGFVSSFIITGNLRTSLKAGLISGAVAFVGDKLFPAKEDIGANETTDKVKGGKNNVVKGKPEPKSLGENIKTVAKKIKDKAKKPPAESVGKALAENRDVVNLERIVTYASREPYVAYFNSKMLMRALLEGMATSIAKQMAKDFLNDDAFLHDGDISNGVEIYNQMTDAIKHFETTMKVFGELKDGMRYTGLLYATAYSVAAIPIAATSEFGIALGEASTSALNYAKNASIAISSVARNAEIATYVYGQSVLTTTIKMWKGARFAVKLSLAVDSVKLIGITTTFASGNYQAIVKLIVNSGVKRMGSSLSKAWP